MSRASLGRGSLGRFSVATDVSASSAATRHWVNSVSDIYGQDEIEELLQDLNRLELATLDTDKFQVRFNSQRGMLRRLTVQEFDIDGSHVGGVGLELPPSPGLPASSPLLPRPRSPGAVSRWPLKYPSNFELISKYFAVISILKSVYLVVTLNVLASRSWDSHTHYQQFREPPDDYGWGGPGHILRPLQAAVRHHLSRHDILLL